MGHGAVAADRHDLQPLAEVVLQAGEFGLDVLHEGAVGTEKQHQHGPGREGRGAPERLAAGITRHLGQAEGRQGRAQGQHRGSGENHDRGRVERWGRMRADCGVAGP